MLFNHLSKIDETGLDYEKIEDFDTLVFCCIPESAHRCDPTTIKVLELLAATDKKYYALAETKEMRNEIACILEAGFKMLDLPKSDFFLLLKANSFTTGKLVGLKIIEIPILENVDNDPDEIFLDSFNLLREKISKINQKDKLMKAGKEIVDKLLGVV